ncbi:FBD-associated F-box protein At5g56370-like [Lolium perenne]|uniref:FBD-associated F-box protein At5g56370-like n=1 Tax=Lolium perenne TaxID=4522 RepID=UPI0021F5F65B|nr:F-box/LRR-repeat protein At3g03360-like [Lolium perenne]
MESPPPFKLGQGQDRISALPDDLLLGILERLDLREAVRAGAVSTRWWHLPHQLPRLHLNVGDFQGATLLEISDAFVGATRRLLSERKCDCKTRRAVKTLGLTFYLSNSHLSSIGHAVEDTVSRGQTERFEFELIRPSPDLIQAVSRTESGKHFMSFSRDCPVAFRWLTGLSLTSLKFRDYDFPSLIGACDKLKSLSLRSCGLVPRSAALKIDAPNSAITELEFIRCKFSQIDLVSVPKLTQLRCHRWRSKNPPLRFGYVPELQKVRIACRARTWQPPFALSACFSMNTRNLSKLHLNFGCQMIWIRPEQHPKQLTAIFSNLTDMTFWNIFPECDLSWTLFILEAAPALQKLILNRTRHSCGGTSKDSAQKTNVVWEPSKDLKHLELKLLVMIGFEEEDKVTNYIRIVMERAVGLKRITLGSHTCKECNAINLESPTTSQTDDACKHRIKEQLTRGSSSTVDIIIC